MVLSCSGAYLQMCCFMVKSVFVGSSPGLTQPGMKKHRSWLEAENLGFTNKREFTVVAKNKSTDELLLDS